MVKVMICRLFGARYFPLTKPLMFVMITYNKQRKFNQMNNLNNTN